MKRAASKLALSRSIDPLAVTLNKLAQLGRDHVPLTEKTLHQYRIIGKRARYIAELSANQPGAALVVEQLKRMQDVIGDWHDWLELGDRAEKLLGSVKDSALVAMLRNVTRAKFRQGADALVEARTALSGKRVGLVSIPAVPSRKPLAEHGSLKPPPQLPRGPTRFTTSELSLIVSLSPTVSPRLARDRSKRRQRS